MLGQPLTVIERKHIRRDSKVLKGGRVYYARVKAHHQSLVRICVLGYDLADEGTGILA